ncbi:non-canonical purine NTP pyrophosphatase [Gordonia rubripertincta]|uniref:dITP/XTP pyrophosphatase n=2 Tax=Gordonia rubripertincta TaxID=36822 RepID=A0AAW6RG21_GORRU|nr:non-canonical purine NTP pyrophosphatase [Gordonia rubripertincta]ASR02726.1 Non-canonical purine NTP pyrophosphatase [Gordonia rubripertincta]MDG6783391.1 non-canonical purine NTP pyrophosphatase [Gordonia rubripertincta]NKY65615.1 non-canonical purine NTP pyrophosphatase [Gordonia rubripertincta]TSD95545.1 non-canonical purine NTP pyrophosphatase [Gordonia rubripertincta]GAB86984.1 non-canonical purine NTP pyrophosphatase [Gordonia rubripertincta NBRC 101908]
MSKVLLASRNRKKLAELQRVVDAAGITGLEILGLDAVPEYPEEPEDGATFEDNALIKARSGARATGLPCLADDSGISVDALNGMPGVLSARWSGAHGNDPANNALLLAQLSDTPDERRGAAFVSACALVLPDGTETVVRGEWRGTVLRAERGPNGFGYDPLFAPDDELAAGRSSAELTPEEKDSLSHRGKALAQLVPALRELAARG